MGSIQNNKEPQTHSFSIITHLYKHGYINTIHCIERIIASTTNLCSAGLIRLVHGHLGGQRAARVGGVVGGVVEGVVEGAAEGVVGGVAEGVVEGVAGL